MRKAITYILLLVVGVVAVFLMFDSMSGDVEVDQDVAHRVSLDSPDLTSEQDALLSSFEDGAQRGIAGFGDPRDAIPSIDDPVYESVDDADEWLQPNDVVFGVMEGNLVAAYPQRILVFHEIVNERVGDDDLSITYCPLTGTTIGFKGKLSSTSTELGVSGYLVNSNLIMYDRATDSWWPQVLGTAISGPAKGSRLDEFPVIWTTWEKWKNEYPNTQVLSRDTGHRRNYGVGGDPYGSYLQDDMEYYESSRTMFELLNDDDRLHAKEVVVGIRDEDMNVIGILKDSLREEGTITVELGGRKVEIVYDETLDFYEASYTDNGEWINAFDAMWFAWAAFYPDTDLIQ